MKICFKCKKEKELGSFYKHKQMADGHLNKCIDCAKSDSLIHRNSHIEAVRAYDRSRGSRQTKEYAESYKNKFPNKYKAHTMVSNAIRDKKLFKDLCELCSSFQYIHAHHDDYLKPLNVRWLCAQCHSQWHRDNGEAKNP